jgi:release factor glutamine methyltransferase
MTIGEALRLARREIDALDARLLIQHVLQCSHAEVIAHENDPLTDELQKRFQDLVGRRIDCEPVSRILGSREFYGRSFQVSPAVLDPRADTETIIDLCLAQPAQRILDLGVGSGAILLTLLAEWPQALGVAADLSQDALTVAQANAKAIGVEDRCRFIQSSWFEKIGGRFDLIVSNPPYIPSHEIPTLERDVKEHDPHLALDGGDDGLEAYRAIASAALAYLAPGGRIVVEIGQGQSTDVVQIFEAQRFRLAEKREDLSGITRALQFVHSLPATIKP